VNGETRPVKGTEAAMTLTLTKLGNVQVPGRVGRKGLVLNCKLQGCRAGLAMITLHQHSGYDLDNDPPNRLMRVRTQGNTPKTRKSRLPLCCESMPQT
jgi:hypothetical protein